MDLIFAVGAGLCCLALGLSAGAALSRRQRRLSEWLHALKRMDCGIQSLLALPQVMRMGGLTELNAMAQLLEKEPLMSLETAWEKSAPGEHGAEKKVLADLFAHLGQGDLHQRRQALKQAGAQMAVLAEEARQEAERSRPLYRSLGGLGGLALTLLLL